jgi:hypothetical protein
MAASDQSAFGAMIENDVESFFDLLPLCAEVRCLLLAGCVTKRWYMHDFLRRTAPRFGFSLHETSGTAGRASTSILRMTGRRVSLPVFFCSVSPSARQNHALLPRRVADNADVIRGWLAEERTPAI